MGGVYGRTEEKRRIYGVLSERIEKQRQRERERERDKMEDRVYKIKILKLYI
jgi:hypothetical protein